MIGVFSLAAVLALASLLSLITISAVSFKLSICTECLSFCLTSSDLLLAAVHEIRLQGTAKELAPLRLPFHQRVSTARSGRTAY